MPALLKPRGKPESSTVGARLDGWKTIATYLDKAERTVKRWEADRGLPIHRVPGGGRAAIYAIAAELDAWLDSNNAFEPGPLDNSEQTTEDRFSSNSDLVPDHLPRLIPPGKTTDILSFLVKRRLVLTAVGLLLVGVAAAALRLGGVRTAAFRIFGRTEAAVSISRPTSIGSVSDADKSLAHDFYLKGRFEWNKRTPESLNRALDDFTQSIVHDPNDAQAYAGLADTYLLLHEYSLMPDREAESRAIAASTKAVELDDSLAEAHRSLAFAEVWGNWDFGAGEKEFRRAIELDPRDPLTHLWFATAFNTSNWYRVTAREFERAQELDPSSAVVLANKSIWLFQIGKRQAGLDLARQVERDDPDFVAPHRYLARMNLSLRNYPEFLIESEKTASLTHDQVLKETTAAARAGFHRDGESGLLHDLYMARKKKYAEAKLAGTPVAEIGLRIGRRDEALRLIHDDFAHHRAEFLWILTDTDLMTLKSDPRYQELLNKLNFPAPPASSQ
jgi:hypothetical protein